MMIDLSTANPGDRFETFDGQVLTYDEYLPHWAPRPHVLLTERGAIQSYRNDGVFEPDSPHNITRALPRRRIER